MSVKEGPISRYIGTASEAKPTSVPKGSTYLEYDEGVQLITPDGGTTYYPKDGNPLAFEFRPGQAALASGMVEAGTRSYSPTTVSCPSTGASASTVWSADITYNPYMSGKIDGVSSGGVIYGQLTLGYIASATTGTDAKFTARIRNTGGTYTQLLALTATVATATTVAYKTYDIPFLQTDANFNAVPFDLAVGVQQTTAPSTNSVQVRVMESSFIKGDFIPGT